MSSRARCVRCPRCLNVLPEPPNVPVYKCGGCGVTLQAKKRNKITIDTASQRLDDDSSEKQNANRVFGNHEVGSSSNQQPLLHSADESDQTIGQDDLHSSNEDQDAANKARYDSVDALSRGVKDYSYGKHKIKQLSNDHEASSSSSNRQSRVNNILNDPRSSTELSGHEDPESSPEVACHNRIDQEQEQNKGRDQDHYHAAAGKKQENTTVDPTSIYTQKNNQLSYENETCSSSLNQQLKANSVHKSPESSPEDTDHNRIDHDYHDDHDQVFLSCRRDVEFEETSSEFEEAFANRRIIRDSDGGSKSSFKSLIAKRLLDTRRKKAVCMDEEDAMLSEDGNTDLHHRRRFDRISTMETAETAGFGGTSYYESDGSVSSFDGSHKHNLGNYRIGSIENENFDSGNGYRFNRRNQIHRLDKDEHRLAGVGSFYGSKELQLNPKHHRSHMIPEDPKEERIELLKMVRELQDQLERSSIPSPQHVSLYNNHVLNYPGRYGHRMAFSGEATAVNRRLDRNSCHHCCPKDRHLSAQLPRQHVCCNVPHYEPNTYYGPRFSALSSPIHNHSESEFSAPVDYRHRNDITKRGHSPKKRYVRPISGGSPWITCYRCSKLLELPQSFLAINKRYHSLRCGACFKVLNFSLSNGTHVSRYYPEETIAAPPSSEVEYQDEFNKSHAEPVSCSDRSFQKSYSAEETDINGSPEYSEKRRKAATMSRDASGSTQPSSSKILSRRKMTSGTKFEPRPNGSPLHRLMGYASPSKVIRGK